jgi:2-oxoglutarate ferredoxin oxidoreductase subunit beta
MAIAVAAGCTFIARCIDVDMKLLDQVLNRAQAHRGTSFVEVYQDCNIFNHQAWFYASQKDSRPEHTVVLEHGKPLVFGAHDEKGIRINGGQLEVVTLDRGLAFLLSQMTHPQFPEPVGILFRDCDQRAYDRLVQDQLDEAKANRGVGDLKALLHEGDTWVVN